MSRGQLTGVHIEILPAFQRIQYLRRTVSLGPLLAGVVIILILGLVPQMHEVYLGILHERSFSTGLFGLAFVILLGLLLDCWQDVLTRSAIDRVYPDHADLRIDRFLNRTGSLFRHTVAILPLAGVALGIVLLLRGISNTADPLQQIDASNSAVLRDLKTTAQRFPVFEITAAIAALITAAAALVLLRFARRRLPFEGIGRLSMRDVVILCGALVTLAAVLLPQFLPPHRVIQTAQLLGPLAMTAIVLIGFIVVLIGLSLISINFRFPVIGTLLALFVVMAGTQIYEAVVATKDNTGITRRSGVNEHDIGPFTDQFSAWWETRKNADFRAFVDAGQPYPIFVVAAEGGGIYAASSVSRFLTRLQQQCPAFAQHVFAISAVSGGAVGASLFAATVKNKELVREIGCKAMGSTNGIDASRFDPQGPTRRVARLIQQDHLSPAIALILPDIASKLGVEADLDRSSVIEHSFACSFDRLLGGASGEAPCAKPSTERADGLWTPFNGHWNVNRAAPALVLNTTWVETGYRAAFAPFPLHAASDGTMFSFFERREKRPDGSDARFGDFADQNAPVDADVSVIESAFVSARFPGIVPAWRRDVPKLWNFVDGGYVDNSGATTALEIYTTLERILRDKGLVGTNPEESKVSLHLIMLTGADTEADFSKVGDGTPLSDTVAPVSALLNVRGQLAGRAVTRALDELERKRTPEKLAGRAGPTRVLVVNLNQETFQFALGWKISRLTDHVLDLMLGRPALCEAEFDESILPADEQTRKVRDTVLRRRDNSCVQKHVRDLLSAIPVEQPAPQPAAAVKP